MPSAQVIDFGSDPYADAMGGFAKNFLNTLNEKTAQRRNEELFSRIANNYGEDADPEDILRDVIKTEGFDQEFKRNKIKELVEYSQLASKNKLNNYEKSKLELRQAELDARNETNRVAAIRAENESKKAANQEAKNKEELPSKIANYTRNQLKDSGLSVEEIADINEFIREQIQDKENPASLDTAFKKAYAFKLAQKDIIDNLPFVERVGKPSEYLGAGKFIGYTDKAYQEAFNRAEQLLQKLHDEDGITSQSDLRRIAARGGWKKEEITQMLQNVFRRNNKKLRGPKKEIKSPEESATIPFEKQGVTAEAAGLDDILFGE